MNRLRQPPATGIMEAAPTMPPAQPTATPNRPTLPPLAWAILALSLAWCAVWFVHALGYWEDDAWIHLEFARSLASGHGFSFNGHIVYGDTSPLWVWLLCAFHAVIPDWMHAGKTLTAFGCLFALTGVFFYSRSLVRQRLSPNAAALFAATMVLVLVTNPYFGYWAFSGMEALTAAGLVCFGGLTVAPKQLSPARFLLGCLIAGIAPLLRPEMSFFTILLGLILLQRLLTMSPPEPEPEQNRVPRVRILGPGLSKRLLLLATGLILFLTPFTLWGRYALHTFGMVVPNTNAAKRADPHDNIPSRLLHVYALGFPLVLIGLALLAAWIIYRLTRARKSDSETQPITPLLHAGGWLLFLWTAINCVFYVLNHTYVQTRYIFVTAPVLTVAVLALAAQSWPRIYRALAAFGIILGIALSFLSTWPLIANKVIVDREYAALAAFIRTLPPDAPVANYSIGECAYLSEHPIVDTGGITRPGMVPYMWDENDDRRLAWIYSQGAKYWLVANQPLPGAIEVYSREIPTTGWFLNPRQYRGTDPLHLWQLPPEPDNIKALIP